MRVTLGCLAVVAFTQSLACVASSCQLPGTAASTQLMPTGRSRVLCCNRPGGASETRVLSSRQFTCAGWARLPVSVHVEQCRMGRHTKPYPLLMCTPLPLRRSHGVPAVAAQAQNPTPVCLRCVCASLQDSSFGRACVQVSNPTSRHYSAPGRQQHLVLRGLGPVV